MFTFVLVVTGFVVASSLVFVELVRRGRSTRSVAQIRAELDAKPIRG